MAKLDSAADTAADAHTVTESKSIARDIIIGIYFTESISHAERERNAHGDPVSEPRSHRDASFIIDSNNVAFSHAFTVKSTFSRWIAAPRLRKNSRSSGV